MNEAIKAMDNAAMALNLCPDLDGLKQLMMMIDVHISAKKTIGEGVTDLYGILGVDHCATYEVMKQRYQKLLLALHPDKNKNKGVEAWCRCAYDLVVKAWGILSDKDKRLEYNIKCGFEAGQGLETMTHVPEGVQNVGEDVGSSARTRPKRGRPAQQDVGSISGEKAKPDRPAREDEGFGPRARPMCGRPAQDDLGSISGERPKRGRPAREDVGSSSRARPKHGRPASEDVGSSSVARPKRGRPVGSSRGTRSNKSARAATRDTFWTKCDKCTTHYNHPMDFINKTLLCQDCDRGFVAQETTPPPTFSTTCNICRRLFEYPRSYLNHNLTCDHCGHGFVAVEKALVIFSHATSFREEPAPYVNHNYEFGSSSGMPGSNTINATSQALIVFQEAQNKLKGGFEECQEKDVAEIFTNAELKNSKLLMVDDSTTQTGANTPNVVHVDGESQENDSEAEYQKWIEEFAERENLI